MAKPHPTNACAGYYDDWLEGQLVDTQGVRFALLEGGEDGE